VQNRLLCYRPIYDDVLRHFSFAIRAFNLATPGQQVAKPSAAPAEEPRCNWCVRRPQQYRCLMHHAIAREAARCHQGKSEAQALGATERWWSAWRAGFGASENLKTEMGAPNRRAGGRRSQRLRRCRRRLLQAWFQLRDPDAAKSCYGSLRLAGSNIGVDECAGHGSVLSCAIPPALTKWLTSAGVDR
jgi:hypothetical protein